MTGVAGALVEILPVHKGQRVTLTWVPGAVPGCGVAELASRRAVAVYAVREEPTDWAGRAFRFEKAEGGTDPAEDAYAVFCGSDGRTRACTCKGFARWNHCKHADCGAALLANRWI